MFRDSIRLPGEKRLVHLHGAVDDTPVEHQLIAEASHESVAEHRLVLVHDALLAVAKDRRGRPGQDAQTIQRLLGPRLLVDADRDVHDDQHQRDSGVAVQPEEHQYSGDCRQQDVDRDERVLAGYLEVGAAGPNDRVIAHSLRASTSRLFLGQTGRRRR